MGDTKIRVSAVLMGTRIIEAFSNDLSEASRDKLVEAQKENDAREPNWRASPS